MQIRGYVKTPAKFQNDWYKTFEDWLTGYLLPEFFLVKNLGLKIPHRPETVLSSKCENNKNIKKNSIIRLLSKGQMHK